MFETTNQNPLRLGINQSCCLLPSGKLTQQWKITIFNGKIHYFNGHFQSQTVSLPEGTSSKIARKLTKHSRHRQGTMLMGKPRDIGGLPAKDNERRQKKSVVWMAHL